MLLYTQDNTFRVDSTLGMSTGVSAVVDAVGNAKKKQWESNQHAYIYIDQYLHMLKNNTFRVRFNFRRIHGCVCCC